MFAELGPAAHFIYKESYVNPMLLASSDSSSSKGRTKKNNARFFLFAYKSMKLVEEFGVLQ